MSIKSIDQLLLKASVKLHAINNARKDFKSNSSASPRTTLNELMQSCTDIATLLKSVNKKIKTPGSMHRASYNIIQLSLPIQQQKIKKLLDRLPHTPPTTPSLKASSHRIKATKSEPEQVGMLRNALDAFKKAGKEKEGLGHILALTNKYPAVAQKIFSKVWDLEGKALVKKHKQRGHAHFGKVAFFGQERRSVSLKTKLEAVKAVLKDITSGSDKPAKDSREKETGSKAGSVHSSHGSKKSTISSAASGSGKGPKTYKIAPLSSAVQKKCSKGTPVKFSKEDPTSLFYFLDNSYPATLTVDKLKYKCAEAAFYAGRDPAHKNVFVGLNAAEAYALKSTVAATSDWPKRNVKHMEKVLLAKFSRDPNLKKLLLATGKSPLILRQDPAEPWETFWCEGTNGHGKNKMGQLLMNLRGKFGSKGLVKPPSSSPIISSPTMSDPKHAARVSDIRRIAAKGYVAFHKPNDPGDSGIAGFLGNYYLSPFTFRGYLMECAEAAFQSGKNPDRMREFVRKNGQEALDHGRSQGMTNDRWKNDQNYAQAWKDRRDLWMRQVLFQKFFQSPKNRELLLATGSAYLVESVPKYRADSEKYWGNGYYGDGKNVLGIFLMELREHFGGVGAVNPPPSYLNSLPKKPKQQ